MEASGKPPRWRFLIRLLVFLAAFALGWGVAAVKDYLYPPLLVPPAEDIAKAMKTVAPREGRFSPGKEHRCVEPIRRVFCVQRYKADPEYETVRVFSYFRALAKPYDLRAWLLDASLKRAVRKRGDWIFKVPAPEFRVPVVQCSLEDRVRSYLCVNSSVFSNCDDVPWERGTERVALVAVSPMVVNPYGPYEAYTLVLGFFGAFETTFPDGQTKRSVYYFVPQALETDPSKGLIACEFIGKPPRPFYGSEEIPESYWKDEFGTWPWPEDLTRDR